MFGFNIFVLIVGLGAIYSNVNGYPDKYEVKDENTNMKIDLMDVLKNLNENHGKQLSLSNSDDDWPGRWMPQRPGEYTPPPKVFHKSEKPEKSSENWDGKWLPSKPGEYQAPPKVFSNKTSKVDETSDNTYVPMGVKNHMCDDGKTNLTVDWDHSLTSHTCYGQKTVPDFKVKPNWYCETIPKFYMAAHKCMTERIEYVDDIPLYGTHRPIWPVYGEYKYLPVQRWLHSLEHGAIVMLYHPCANKMEVEKLKKIVKGCLRRHIITPYNLLDDDRPLALLSWGCRLTMSHVNKNIVTQFIRERALHAPENQVYEDGEFEDQLLEKAKVISTQEDTQICANLM
ncbi:hypothetical protein TKK_0004421 [Trichogramma kaykai]|uniref:DUF3105 domain-containing protein n=1 Tax=Trichogramma kaykai TaxID=54128 RepID=A0ABD2XN06_9HYME